MPTPSYATSGGTKCNETRFADKVERFLKVNEGHKILFNRANRGAGKKQIIDIFSLKDKMLYYTEVKGGIDSHKLQTGVGQLLYHRFAIENNIMQNSAILDGYFIKYQLIFPKKFERDEHFTHGFLQFLESIAKITVRFI